MKWNIFERLNALEKELHELREVVRYQMDTIISLQLADIGQEGSKLVESQEVSDNFSAAPIRSEGEPVFTKAEVDEETLKRRKYKRDWYAKNKNAIFERKKAAKKLQEAQSQGNTRKTYYWKNKEKMREYARQYQQKKRAERAAQENK
jgi:hypothetical protein